MNLWVCKESLQRGCARIYSVTRGKKLPDADLRALKRAQRLVEGEFSFALGIPQEQVDAYIRSVLGVGE